MNSPAHHIAQIVIDEAYTRPPAQRADLLDELAACLHAVDSDLSTKVSGVARAVRETESLQLMLKEFTT